MLIHSLNDHKAADVFPVSLPRRATVIALRGLGTSHFSAV